MVASGTLSNGQTVILQSDGTVTGVASITQVGVSTVFRDGALRYTSSVFDSANNKVVVAYTAPGVNAHGEAVVGNITGTAVTFGSVVEFESAATAYVSAAYDSNNEKVVIAYQDDDNSDKGTAVVGTVSGTSISFGTPVVFVNSAVSYCSATFDSTNNKVVIAFRDEGNSNYGTAIVGTVSGTSISFGAESVFESANLADISATFDSTNGKVVITYSDIGNNYYGTAIVGTVSGTSISYGSAVVFESAATYDKSATFDPTNGKVVIAYQDGGNSNNGTAIVGTVSGTSISFGTPVVFESANTQQISATFDSTKDDVIIAYQDRGNSNYGTAIVGTVSGTSISFDTPIVFESAASEYMAAAYDSTNDRTLIAYKHDGNSEGTGVVFKNSGNTNLTSSNFIGFSDAAYSDGDTAKIQIEGSVDDAQTGLTTAKVHYVQFDGSLSTTADDPSVIAGTAVSGTEILIKQ